MTPEQLRLWLLEFLPVLDALDKVDGQTFRAGPVTITVPNAAAQRQWKKRNPERFERVMGSVTESVTESVTPSVTRSDHVTLSVTPSVTPSPAGGVSGVARTFSPEVLKNTHLSESDRSSRATPAEPESARVSGSDVTLSDRARHTLRDKLDETWNPPSEWPEVQAVFRTFEEVWRKRLPPVTVGMRHPRLRVVVERFAEGATVEKLQATIRGSKLSEHLQAKPELQTLETILRDVGTVEKYLSLLPEERPAAVKTDPPRRFVEPTPCDDPVDMPPEVAALLGDIAKRAQYARGS